ncbi:MAG: acyltransferase [Sphingomonas sp.]|uniref:acyltransferase family protein n=1 Tax=Sphingomonas sp. TaxID=28214 RepID=UPI001ACE5F4D|nr:acyltransferase [Sphingomonas sp.]MBN8806913.1 acyltransferase [Sphingomonas sp.]
MTAPSEVPALRTYAGDRRYYWNLESLRFLCAILVTIVHIPWPTSLKAVPFIPEAWLFVDFFFVLSGFVIAMNYRDRLQSLGSVKRFLIRRFFRLYPLHLVTLLAMAALIAARNLVGTPGSEIGPATVTKDWSWLVPLNLTLLQAMGFTNRQILNAPSWSISTEWFAYCTFALIALGCRHRLQWSVWSFLAIAGMALLAWLNGPLGVEGVFAHSFIRCIASFALGVLVQMVIDRKSTFSLPPSIAGWSQLAVIACALTMIARTGSNQWIGYFVPFVFALLIGLMAADHGSIVRRILEIKPLEHLGKRSYSIYMVHTPIVTSIDFVLRRLHQGESILVGNAAALVYLAFVIATSEMTYRYVEQPWRVFGRKVAA